MTTATQRASARPAAATGRFLGTGDLVRLAVRRDRVLIPSAVLGFAGLAGLSAATTAGLYPDPAQRFEAASLVNSTAALVALYGRIYDPSSEGALAMFKLTSFGAALVAVLMTVVVVRHTRTEEEAGRLELLGATRISRTAPLQAALIVACGASLAIGVATGAALTAAGLPVGGSFAFGLGWASAGIAFAAVAGVCAQLTVSARAATGLGVVAIAVSYALRAVGDLAADAPGWQSWLSPIGWNQQLRAYAGERWWVLLLPLLVVAVAVPSAFALRGRRDLGAGLIQQRAGAAGGRFGLVGLVWRLQRPVLLAWVVGFALFGVVLGSIADSVSAFFDSPEIARILAALGGEQALTDAFLAAELGMMGVIAAAYGVLAAQRMREEEADGHAEVVLAVPVNRWRWAATHFLLACAGLGLLTLVYGAAVGVGFALAVPDSATGIGDVVLAALARLPAGLVMASVVLLAFGWAPRLTSAAWGVYALAVVIGEFGAVWNAPQWLRNLSPFVHSPVLPSAQADLGALPWLIVGAAALAGLGLVGWRRRDTPA